MTEWLEIRGGGFAGLNDLARLCKAQLYGQGAVRYLSRTLVLCRATISIPLMQGDMGQLQRRIVMREICALLSSSPQLRFM